MNTGTNPTVYASDGQIRFKRLVQPNRYCSIQNHREVAELQAEEVQTLANAVNISNDLFRNGYATYLT